MKEKERTCIPHVCTPGCKFSLTWTDLAVFSEAVLLKLLALKKEVGIGLERVGIRTGVLYSLKVLRKSPNVCFSLFLPQGSHTESRDQ